MKNFKRKKIGLVFHNYENWTGGTYYILNLVSALNLLPDDKKVQLIVFTKNQEDFLVLKRTNYPYLIQSTDIKELNEMHYSFFERFINKMSRLLIKKNVLVKKLGSAVLDAIFPVSNEDCVLPGRDFYYGSFFELIPKIYWIPDFQEHYLPQFFSVKEIENRKRYQKTISEKKTGIVFSSKDAENDFHKFYPDSIATSAVLNFAVTHPSYRQLDGEMLMEEFNISQPYFFSPNQFWIHKNHMLVLKAVKILKEQGKSFIVCFSGKETDSRGHNYLDTLKAYVKNNELDNHIRFLGFIDRDKQLKLMSEAIAVIQPSLFEGWSTVVEDAKAMNQYIIASDLKVHQEQLSENYVLFDPQNERELSEKMKTLLDTRARKTELVYGKNILKFAEDFIRIINQPEHG